MTDRRRVGRRFLGRSSLEVAPALLGRVLVRGEPDGARTAVRIVETEAYDESDPASHSYRGPTERTAVMFGPAGHLYVYFTYGMHFCMNVVTGPSRAGSAVLLRAGEPLEGLEAMGRRRRTQTTRLLCSGPARLAQALDVGRELNGEDLVAGSVVWLERGSPARSVGTGTRVGIRRGVGRPWRFWIEGSPFVSRGRGSGD